MSRNSTDILDAFQPPFYIQSAVAAESQRNSNQTVTLSTAGIRALIYQLQALYLRTPVKLFRPSRFDYLAYVRAVANKDKKLDLEPWRFSTHSSIGMLVTAIKKEGWRFIPDQVLPPLIANSATGLILYGTYLTVLDRLDSTQRTKEQRFYYSPADTWKAGFIAGVAQSLAAAPVDAIYARATTAELINGAHQNLWMYGYAKLREIGLVGVFAGYGFSVIKESLGFAFYFSTFETVKNQGYYWTHHILKSYWNLKMSIRKNWATLTHEEIDERIAKLEEQRAARILRTSFILLAGASAAFALLAVQYPISKIQTLHLSRLEALDIYNSSTQTRKPFIKVYYNSYIDTYREVLKLKRKSKQSYLQLGYKGFVRNALTTLPATSIGLLVFEIMRTRLADSMESGDHDEFA